MKIGTYLKDVYAELQHVVWPTRQQAIIFTATVIIISVVVAYFLGLFDLIFTRILSKVL